MIRRVARARSIGCAYPVQGTVVEAARHRTIEAREGQVANTGGVVAHAMPCAVARAVYGFQTVESQPPRVAVASAVHARSPACAVGRTFK